MIFDKIENLDKYPQISEEIKKFIRNCPKTCGHYEINETDFANIEEYTTKKESKFERHRLFADIQIVLNGEEKLFIGDAGKVLVPYVEDIEFLDGKPTSSVLLDGTNFVMIFPDEPHMPQMALDKESHVKKLVVKILQTKS